MQNNYFSGPSTTTNAAGETLCPSHASDWATVDSNCLTDDPAFVTACYATSQRNLTVDCVWFCDAAAPGGACAGHGTCYQDPDTYNPTCQCESGYAAEASEETSSTCVSGPGASPPPPAGEAVGGGVQCKEEGSKGRKEKDRG